MNLRLRLPAPCLALSGSLGAAIMYSGVPYHLCRRHHQLRCAPDAHALSCPLPYPCAHNLCNHDGAPLALVPIDAAVAARAPGVGQLVVSGCILRSSLTEIKVSVCPWYHCRIYRAIPASAAAAAVFLERPVSRARRWSPTAAAPFAKRSSSNSSRECRLWGRPPGYCVLPHHVEHCCFTGCCAGTERSHVPIVGPAEIGLAR